MVTKAWHLNSSQSLKWLWKRRGCVAGKGHTHTHTHTNKHLPSGKWWQSHPVGAPWGPGHPEDTRSTVTQDQVCVSWRATGQNRSLKQRLIWSSTGWVSQAPQSSNLPRRLIPEGLTWDLIHSSGTIPSDSLQGVYTGSQGTCRRNIHTNLKPYFSRNSSLLNLSPAFQPKYVSIFNFLKVLFPQTLLISWNSVGGRKRKNVLQALKKEAGFYRVMSFNYCP